MDVNALGLGDDACGEAAEARALGLDEDGRGIRVARVDALDGLLPDAALVEHEVGVGVLDAVIRVEVDATISIDVERAACLCAELVVHEERGSDTRRAGLFELTALVVAGSGLLGRAAEARPLDDEAAPEHVRGGALDQRRDVLRGRSRAR